jgi:hypothetical protein
MTKPGIKRPLVIKTSPRLEPVSYSCDHDIFRNVQRAFVELLEKVRQASKEECNIM